MTDATEFEIISNTDVARAADAARGVAELLIGLGILVVLAMKTMAKVCNDVSEAHDRAERLKVYRLRHRWKRSDLANLLTYELTRTAQCRLPKLRGRGRSVVRPHEDLFVSVARKFSTVLPAFLPEASPSERLKAIKNLPWWPHYVESAYRGEYKDAKGQGWSAPAEHAERLVGRELGISQSTVRQLCGNIRALRAADPDLANFPPVTISRLLAWVEHGRLVDPWDRDGGHEASH